jgi:hypothetical protein
LWPSIGECVHRGRLRLSSIARDALSDAATVRADQRFFAPHFCRLGSATARAEGLHAEGPPLLRRRAGAVGLHSDDPLYEVDEPLRPRARSSAWIGGLVAPRARRSSLAELWRSSNRRYEPLLLMNARGPRPTMNNALAIPAAPLATARRPCA